MDENHQIFDNTVLINKDGKLNISLYHGTSTIFLNSIIKNGLGGFNPVNDWKLLDLSREVFELSEKHLKGTAFFELNSGSFENISKQSNDNNANFQHGDIYLSPTRFTAARYAINSAFGSEILTCSIDFIRELIKMDIEYVKVELPKKYPGIFRLLALVPSPLLIEVTSVDSMLLLNEHGESPASNFEKILKYMNESPDYMESSLTQNNFRLKSPKGLFDLKVWLINTHEFNGFLPRYSLHEIRTDRKTM